MLYKLGLSIKDVDGMESGTLFRELKSAGLSAAEISTPLPRIQTLDCKKAAKNAADAGILLWSFHLPFLPFEDIDISSTDKSIREYTLKLHKELIRKAADAGIDKFVIHSSGEPIDDKLREDQLNYCMESLSDLADFAAEHGAVIAVEDLPRTCLGNCADEILRLISANDKLRVCFDTNHLLKDNNENFMNKLGDKIITVHISDYDFINERHWLPGEGKLDWDMMLENFKKIGYNGSWIYELDLKTPPSITRRDLVYGDFTENADAIFNHREIPLKGVPKANLK